MNAMRFFKSLACALVLLAAPSVVWACTGITLKAKSGNTVVARTIEWGGSALDSHYVTVPRGYEQQSYLPEMRRDGMKFKAKYGYVGLSVQLPDFVVEGLNEAGLSAGLFYFPAYGKYQIYDEAKKGSTIADLQLVSWLLGNFATIDEAVEGLKEIRICGLDPHSSTVHWRIVDKSGRQVVVEVVNEQFQIHENKLGVLTNAPGFEWQLTNLNNYVNLFAGTAEKRNFGAIGLTSFGSGSAMLGLPGDITPPSRFVRAAFYQTTAPVAPTADKAVLTAFHILNNFDIPIGVEFRDAKLPADIPSATQWTSATDLMGGKLYYRTMYNSRIRMIDLKKIAFDKVKYSAHPLDKVREEIIEPLN